MPQQCEKVHCRKIGDRWYVTYGGLIRQHYAFGPIAVQHAMEIGDVLRADTQALASLPVHEGASLS